MYTLCILFQQSTRRGLRGYLFGDRDTENTERSLQETLRKVHSEYLSSLRKVSTLQSELEQRNRDIASKNRDIREKSEQNKNLRDKMDALEVDLGIERHRTSTVSEELQSKTQNLDQALQELGESRVQIAELETQMEELEESTKLDQETLECVCLEEISQRDEKLQEQSREIESLKKRVEAFNKDIHRPGIKSANSKQLPLVVDKRRKKEGSHGLIKRLLRDHVSSSSDSEVYFWNAFVLKITRFGF